MNTGHWRKQDVPPAAVERMLRSNEASRVAGSDARAGVGAHLVRLRRELLRLVCSDAWFRDCWETGQPYPPAADTTPMRACECGFCALRHRVWPAYYCTTARTWYASDGQRPADLPTLSYECFLESLSDEEAAQVPSSPSGIALRAVREGRIKLRRQRTRLGKRRAKSAM